MLLEDFNGRVLPFDLAAAQCAAGLHLSRTRPANDARIAATAINRGLTLVTRDTSDFEGIGVKLLNPYRPD
jgi:predicted nucleic acid-binding protein